MKRLFFSLLAISIISIGSTIPSEKDLPTILRITILDGLGNVQEDASVQLFPTEDDYTNDTNPVTEVLTTDAKGRLLIRKGLEPTVYYVQASKGDLNNYGGGIKTDSLRSGKVNKINIVID